MRAVFLLNKLQSKTRSKCAGGFRSGSLRRLPPKRHRIDHTLPVSCPGQVRSSRGGGGGFLAQSQLHYLRVDMLGADAEADDAGGDTAEQWKSGKQAGGKWRV